MWIVFCVFISAFVYVYVTYKRLFVGKGDEKGWRGKLCDNTGKVCYLRHEARSIDFPARASFDSITRCNEPIFFSLAIEPFIFHCYLLAARAEQKKSKIEPRKGGPKIRSTVKSV